MAISVALDVDPGIDDALALMLALRSPELNLALVTTVAGNGPLEMTTRNALRVLDYLGATDVPVAAGANAPLMKSFCGALGYHGADALGGVDLADGCITVESTPADDMLFDFVAAAPGQRVIVATGPLTNVARAFMRHEDMPSLVKELIIMGGAFQLTRYGDGNTTPWAEFNIWQDPDGARIVFHSGVPLTIVGLDVTNDPSGALVGGDLTRLRTGGTREAALAADLLDFALSTHPNCAMHDPLALAAAVAPSLFEFVTGQVDVNTSDDEQRGRTLFRPDDASTRLVSSSRVAVRVDGPRFKELFISRMLEK